ncbi:MAG TPA: hypothetical protein PKA64_03815, partial [Myxococcota bacterium]|nr:hypothetical protein [Myxococcota bacterium]
SATNNFVPGTAVAFPSGRFVPSLRSRGCSGNTAPVATACVLSPPAPRESDDLRAVAAGTDAEGQAITWTYTWTKNGAVDGAVTGATYPNASTARGDVVSVACRPSDGTLNGTALSSASVTVRGGKPVATSCALTPVRPGVDDDVTVTAAGSDPDGDAISWAYVWRRNGVVDGAVNGTVYPASRTSAGDFLTAECLPSDTDGAGLGMSAAFVRVNRPPVMTACVLYPDPPESSDDVHAYAWATDADGDLRTYSYTWTKNGVVDPSETGSSYPSTKTVRDDVIGVSCGVSDPYDAGAGMSADDVTVLNGVPTQPVVRVLPDRPTLDDDLVCTLPTPSTDSDGDAITYTITWTHDGVAWAGATSTTSRPGDTVLAGDLAVGTWACTAVPTDGVAYGDGGSDAAIVALPAAVPGAVLSAGDYAWCATFDDGQVRCVGSNDFGALGLGWPSNLIGTVGESGEDLSQTLYAADVGTNHTVTQLAAASDFACALRDDQRVVCWGVNDYGQLGVGSTQSIGDRGGEMGDALVPVDLGTASPVVEVDVGIRMACARTADGQARCWGNLSGFGAASGTRGDAVGEMGAALPVVNLGAGHTTIDIAVGDGYACFLREDGSVVCYGSASGGRLGLGAAGTNTPGDAAIAVDLGEPAVAIDAGEDHACAILVSGDLKCWGRNDYGQLGYGHATNVGDAAGTLGDALPAVDLGPNLRAVQVSAGGDHTCAVLSDASLKCWGRGAVGQIGSGDSANLGDEPGEMGLGLAPVVLPGGAQAAWVSAGGNFACAVTTCGDVTCWGSGGEGQIGLGDSTTRYAPEATIAFGVDRFVRVDGAGACRTGGDVAPTTPGVELALSGPVDRSLRCAVRTSSIDADGDQVDYDFEWELDGAPWLGAVSTTGRSGDTIAEADLVAGEWTCIATPTDGVHDGVPAIATLRVGDAPGPDLVTTSGYHTCALIEDGRLACYGLNTSGQLGIGNALNRGDAINEIGTNTSFTTAADPGQEVVRSALGSSHTCVLYQNGQVRCWGQNAQGQLGVGSTVATLGAAANQVLGASDPTVFLGPRDVAVELGAGEVFNCALLSTGQVKCWGNNTYGQLGIGSTDTRGTSISHFPLGAVDLGTDHTAVDLAVGASHACALLDDGAIVCWGRNNFGQLGRGDAVNVGDAAGETGDAFVPVNLGAGFVPVAVTAGGDVTCAVSDAGALKCWGYNALGNLGLGDTTARGTSAAQMGASLPAISLGAGLTVVQALPSSTHTCALLSSGALKCWGGYQGLGYAGTNNRGDTSGEMGASLPAVAIPGGATIASFTTGYQATCALTTCGDTYCWGTNANGQLGVGSTTTVATPGAAQDYGAPHYVPYPGAELCP